MKMNKILSIICITHLLLHTSHASNTYRGKAFNTFYGYSNVHDFVGTVNSKPFRVNQEKENLNFNVSFPIIEMDTKKAKRNRQMFGMFNQKQFPNVVTQFTNIPLQKLLESKDFKQDFVINIKSKDFPAVASITNIKNENHDIDFDIECELQLNEIGLKAPSMMFGMIKVKNKVLTKTHFELKKTSLAIIKDQLKTIKNSK